MNNVSENTRSKWRQLCELLVELTAANAVSWKEGVNEGEFITSVSGNVIAIWKKQELKAESFTTVVKVVITSPYGGKVDEFDDEDIDNRGETTYFEILNDLIEDLGRKVSGADRVLDEIISSLKRKK